MHVLNFLFLASTVATGALAAPTSTAPTDYALAARALHPRSGQCATDDSLNNLATDQDVEDFTAQSKRSLDDVDDLDLDLDFDLLSHDLEARANRQWCGTTPTGGFGQYVDDTTSNSAVNTGFALAYAGVTRISNTGRHYPKRFYNNEAIADIPFYCPGGPWYEFPVYPNANRVFGANTNRPGTERVIFDRCGNWCATITHRGETANGFHGCTAA